MTEKCFDIGTIQAFLDGELASYMSEKVACHTAACDVCAVMLAEAEEESAFAFSALEEEFSTFVPTNRLWTKINDSIEGNKKTFWQSVTAYFTNPTVAAFASLVIVGGLFIAMLNVKPDDNKNDAAEIIPEKSAAIAPFNNGNLPVQKIETNEPNINNAPSGKIASSINNKNKFGIVKANFSEKENNPRAIRSQKQNTIVDRNPQPFVDARTSNKNLLGEDSYIKTIATLEKTVDSRKDEVLKPAARFAFERDLAATDDAIKKMKAEVGKNPKNEAAKNVLRASYQNKIDLLNSVAEKSELMASLK